jgi:NifB/MoaA-like Fe-S oxidoreductase
MAPGRTRLTAERGEPVLFISDEFYITADLPLPDYSDTDILPQLENGVGMVWEFMEPWSRHRTPFPAAFDAPLSVAILTGALGARVLAPLVARLARIRGLMSS